MVQWLNAGSEQLFAIRHKGADMGRERFGQIGGSRNDFRNEKCCRAEKNKQKEDQDNDCID